MEASRQGLGIAPNGQNQTFPDFGRENQGLGRGDNGGFEGKNCHICPKSTFSARELGLGPEEGFRPIASALLDSGARHSPKINVSGMKRWRFRFPWRATIQHVCASRSQALCYSRRSRAGSVQPIVPMGAVIEQLGYSLVWSAGSCKLYPPALRLRVKNGCPEVVESQALTLISRLEEHKLEQVEELKSRTEQGKDRIRQAKLAMDKTWWDHWVDYVSSPNTGSGQMAVSTAPFFQEVPDKALQGILPPQGVDVEPFWDAIKRALPHLNRRRRKALHQSKNWVVNLFAGVKSHKPLMKLESDDTVGYSAFCGPKRVPRCVVVVAPSRCSRGPACRCTRRTPV